MVHDPVPVAPEEYQVGQRQSPDMKTEIGNLSEKISLSRLDLIHTCRSFDMIKVMYLN